jgi:hypothetical protein
MHLVFTTGEKPRFSFNKGLGGSQSRYKHFGEENILFTLSGFKPRIVQPVSYSLYNDSEMTQVRKVSVLKNETNFHSSYGWNPLIGY